MKSDPLGPILLFGAAMRAIIETLLKSLAAEVAAGFLHICPWSINPAGFVDNMAAALALDKRLALANTKNGYKEKG
jgi:hypothetical protein